MADIALVMTENGGDVALDGNDLLRDDGLETSVWLSLFIDRLAEVEQIPAELPQDDRRGYWGDSTDDKMGSLLWLLSREKQLPVVLSRAKQYTEQALEWMLTDKVAKSIVVTTSFAWQGCILIAVDIFRPGAREAVSYRYQYEWATQAAKRVA